VPAADVWEQEGGELGARIESILSRGLENAPGVFAIGADSPLLSACHLTAAMETLRRSDAVMGDCEDGGFYLLGVRQCPSGLLAGVPWGCAETSASVLERLEQQNWSVGKVETLFDVDRPADVLRLAQCLSKDEFSAPATRAWMRRWQASHGLGECA
jgi:glycosyltransferase A (GT-A) superfamily protein (DUF2064 family)